MLGGSAVGGGFAVAESDWDDQQGEKDAYTCSSSGGKACKASGHAATIVATATTTATAVSVDAPPPPPPPPPPPQSQPSLPGQVCQVGGSSQQVGIVLQQAVLLSHSQSQLMALQESCNIPQQFRIRDPSVHLTQVQSQYNIHPFTPFSVAHVAQFYDPLTQR